MGNMYMGGDFANYVPNLIIVIRGIPPLRVIIVYA